MHPLLLQRTRGAPWLPVSRGCCGNAGSPPAPLQPELRATARRAASARARTSPTLPSLRPARPLTRRARRRGADPRLHHRALPQPRLLRAGAADVGRARAAAPGGRAGGPAAARVPRGAPPALNEASGDQGVLNLQLQLHLSRGAERPGARQIGPTMQRSISTIYRTRPPSAVLLPVCARSLARVTASAALTLLLAPWQCVAGDGWRAPSAAVCLRLRRYSRQRIRDRYCTRRCRRVCPARSCRLCGRPSASRHRQR